MNTDEPAAGAETKLRVFLSYSRKDKEFVVRLANALIQRGYLADFDQSTHHAETGATGIAPTDEWWIRLQDMIAAADVMVLVVSPDSAASKVVDEEISYARSLAKRVIAITCRQLDFITTPPRLSALNVSDWFVSQDFEHALDQLCVSLDRDVQWLRASARYTVEAKAWADTGRVPDRLLFGEEIGLAEAWSARRPASAPEVSELVLSFLAASRSADTDRQAREKQSIRRTRGLQRWIGVAVAAAFVITVVGGWFVIDGQRNLGRRSSLMLAQAARQASDSDDHLRAVQLAILASRDEFLSPSAPEARAELAYNASALRLEVDFRGHQSPVSGAILSWDEKQILTWSADGTARLWDAKTGVEIASPLIHNGIGTASFSGDDRRILTAGSDGLARIWDTVTGAQIGSPLNHGTPLRGAQYVDDERRIITWGDQAKYWDAYTGAPIGPASALTDLQSRPDPTFSPDGTRRLTWDTFAVRQWDVATGAQIGPPMQPSYHYEDGVRGAVFSRDQEHILSWGLGMSSARQWDAKTGKQIWTTDEFGVVGAAYSHDQSRVLTWTIDGTAQQWDSIANKKIGLPMTHAAKITGAAYSEDDGRILTWSEDGTAKLWSSAEIERTPPKTFKHKGPVVGAFFQSIGDRVLTWSEDSTTRLWDAQTGEQIGMPLEHDGPVIGATFSTVGDRILTWSLDGTARIWTTEPEEAERKFLDGAAVNAVVSQVCKTKLRGSSVPVIRESRDDHFEVKKTPVLDSTGRPVLRAVGRIDSLDIDKALILSGREGEDICSWSPPWYDGMLRAMLGWAFR